ncbi:MAG TPA: YciI family protein, partial [Polyangiaceae bacterium]|nr:YciI family protein [Polyangiaceae bacterium]
MNNTTDCSCKKCNRAACGCSADGNNGCSCSDALQASSKGARVRASGIQRTVIDGPFAETKELLVGTSIIQGKSKDEAIAFANRRIEVPME